MPVVCLVTEIFVRRVVRIARANGRRSVVADQERHGIAAAIGQLGVPRSRERHLIPIGGDERGVVRREEVVPPPPVVTHVDRRPRQNFVLDADTELPVAVAHAPALEHLRIHARGRDRRPPIHIRPRTAFQVGERVQEVALSDPVAVRVSPRAINGRDQRGRGVLDRVRLTGEHALQILSDVHPERGLPVAEQVVHRTATRRNVPVALDAVCAGKDVRVSELVGREDTVLLARAPARGHFKAQRSLKRQAPARPGVLDIERAVAQAIADASGPHPRAQLDWSAVVERVAELLCDLRSGFRHHEAALMADLQVVAA